MRVDMKMNIVAAFLLLLLTATFAQARIKVDYRFKDLEGRIYTPATLQGSLVILYIGSTF